jgi:Carboxypeptidase regulatory-like domain
MSVVRVARPRLFVLLLAAALLFAPMGPVRPAEAAGSASISGRVTDRDGQPLAGVTVSVNGPGHDHTSRSTDDEGRFVAEGLPAGNYTVCYYPAGQDLVGECWEDIEPATPSRTPIEVGDGRQVTGIDAVLVRASYLRGTVTDSRGAPVEGALVSETWYGEDWFSWGEPTLTAADGSFEIGPLYSGVYTLRFSDNWSNRYATEWWDDAPTDTTATRLQVVRGESIDGLDAVLADLARVSGRVNGADGSSASGARVRVFKVTAPHAYDEVGSGGALMAGGRYEIALQPGTYRLAFDAAPGKYRTEYWNNARSIDTAHDVVITGTTPVTDLDAVLGLARPVQLTRRPTISGRARVGERLTVGHGAWDVPSVRFSYQWRADGSIIPRATERRLLLTPRLRGKHIKVRVTATANAHERSPGVAMTRRTQAVAPASH